MRAVLQKISEHADWRLPKSPAGPGADLPAFRSFLRVESGRLRMKHRSGASGSEIVAARTYLLDRIVRHAFELAIVHAGLRPERPGQAVVALGGYGRAELAPGSDIDLLFLHDGRAGSKSDAVVEYLLYLLWDLGLTLGHAYRTVPECTRIAGEDLISRNALAEARFIAGDQDLFSVLGCVLEDSFRRPRQVDRYVRAMEAALLERHSKFGNSFSAAEPHIKEGAGGLRDLHTVRWLAQARFGWRTLDEIWANGFVPEVDCQSVAAAYDHLLRVRNEIHFQTGRKSDVLALDLQHPVAAALRYSPAKGHLASELMMRDYYQSACRIHRFTLDFLDRIGNRPSRSTLSSYLRKKHVYDGFEIQPTGVFFSRHDRSRDNDPIWVVRAFAVAQKAGSPFSPELRQNVRIAVGQIDRRYRTAPDAARMFLDILKKKGTVSTVLRSMEETGFLGKFLPEFGRTGFWVKRDSQSQCTFSEHSLSAVERLEALVAQDLPGIGRSEGPAAVSSAEFVCLVLALLVHHGIRHAGEEREEALLLAGRLTRRLHLDEAEREILGCLLSYGAHMKRIAEHRDFTEEQVVADFSQKVGTRRNLDLLYLFAVSESAAAPSIGPTLSLVLLADLHRACCQHFGAEPETRSSGHPGADAEILREHFRLMPRQYSRRLDLNTLERHAGLVNRLSEREITTDWCTLNDAGCSELTVCTRDFSGLFARLAGTLTSLGLDILSASLNSRKDGIVLDIFRVRRFRPAGPVPETMWEEIDAALEAAIQPGFEIESLLPAARRPRRWMAGHQRVEEVRPSIRFDSRTSAQSTIVEVRAEDRPGLAYRIARTLTDLDVDIRFARITTERHYALDIFYVRGASGGKLSASEAVAVGRELLAELRRQA